MPTFLDLNSWDTECTSERLVVTMGFLKTPSILTPASVSRRRLYQMLEQLHSESDTSVSSKSNNLIV